MKLIRIGSLVVRPETADLFVQFVTDWHTGADHLDLHQGCAIYDTLEEYKQNKATLEDIADVFMDLDGDVDAWDLYLERSLQK